MTATRWLSPHVAPSPPEKNSVFTTYRNSKVLLAPLEDAAGKTRNVNPAGRSVSLARAIGIAFGDE